MSRTFKTKSGSRFLTSINSEHLIGHVCNIVGAKHYVDTYLINAGHPCPYTMSYEGMTKDETNFASEEFLKLIPQAEALYPTFQHYFDKSCDYKAFVIFLERTAKEFKDSKGYIELG
jgi:hypothetical protein